MDSNGKTPDLDVVNKLLDDINTALYNILAQVQQLTTNPKLSGPPNIPHPSALRRRVNEYVPTVCDKT